MTEYLYHFGFKDCLHFTIEIENFKEMKLQRFYEFVIKDKETKHTI